MFITEIKKMGLRSFSQPLELIVGIVVLFALFLGVQLGVRETTSSAFARQETVYIFALWMVVSNCVALLNQETANDIKMGLMEKMAVRPEIIPPMLMARCVYAFAHTIFSIVMLGGILVFFNRVEDPVLVLTAVFLALPYGLAFGLIMVGFSYLTRQTLSLVLFLQCLVVAILVLLYQSIGTDVLWMNLLPMAPLRNIGSDFAIDQYSLNACVWIAIGVMLNFASLRLAKKLGTFDPHYSM